MAQHPGEAQTTKYPTLTEVVLRDPDQFPKERVEYHKGLAGTIFASDHPSFVLNDNEDLVSPPVTNPHTIKIGAEAMCDTCPAKPRCDPVVTAQSDNRIVVKGWNAGAHECKIAHPTPHAQTLSHTPLPSIG